MCCSARAMTYTELLNMALGVDDDQEAMRKSSMTKASLYDPPYQGGGYNNRRDY